MTTWQESNGGSFLAGIGSQNNNAPRSIDNLPTLGLIQQNNEFTRQGGNNVGLQGLQGLYGLSNMHQQEQQQRQQQAFQSEYGAALQSGDREQIRALLSKYPQQVQAIQDGMKWSDDDYRATLGDLATRGQIAAQSPKTFYSWIGNNAEALQKAGADPSQLAAMYQQDPAGTAQLIGSVGMHALGHEKYWDLQDKIAGREIDRGKLAEDIRSNQASEANTRRGQNISRENSIRSGSGGGAVPASVREYQYFNSLSPEQQQTYLKVRGRPGGNVDHTVQLSDGRTVTVSGKLHGAGASAFYEGKDDNGNMVRVPASSINAPATSAANAQNYAMSKDINDILDADEKKLNFMTGITGGVGEASLFAEQSSRVRSQDERSLYTASRRIQGKMQNQGVAAARDMGASGINTVAEAKMYFQGMPQVDYSSPQAMKQSIRDIQEYTDSYNQQYNVDVGGGQRQQVQPTQKVKPSQQNSGFSSLWGD